MDITIVDIKKDPSVELYIQKADEHLAAMGFTEHGFRHANLVSNIARNIMTRLLFSPRQAELAAIAGYIHDIGNMVSRQYHSLSGATIAERLLSNLNMKPDEVATIIGAIGNHEEEYGHAVNEVASALILADKSDVHRTRVRNPDLVTFDIHDRVNYAVTRSFLDVEAEEKTITLNLTIDTHICPVMEYFEIFLLRMVMCRRAAKFLGASFNLIVNETKLL